MADEAENLAGIRFNAELVVKQFSESSGLEHFGFDAPSVQWVDGFINRQRVREDVSPEFVGKMVNVLGSYLGQCIIRSYGGKWSLGERGWYIEFDTKNAMFPYAKVEKQFANGAEDSIFSFFTAIPILFLAFKPANPPANQTVQRTGPTEKSAWLKRLFRRGPSTDLKR